MKILNLHGFLGKIDNKNYQALCELLPDAEITSPKLAFEHLTPQALLQQLAETAGAKEIALVVGQSLGGAFGLIIAKQLGVPCILTNPCLEPANTKIIQESDKLSKELFQEYEKMNFLQPYEKAYILLSDQDEIISGNPERCRKLTPHVKMTSGKHSGIDDLKGELGALLKELEASGPANG